MRIGILTLPLNVNYGGILQAYALKTTLKRMGHDVMLINVDNSDGNIISLRKKISIYLRGFFCKDLQRRRNEYQRICEKLREFVTCYIDEISVTKFICLDKNYFDAIIVGSDQIWRPIYYPNIFNAYLDFANDWNIKRIAYAASFGTDKWEYTLNQTDKCKFLLGKFNKISVREESGIDMCTRYFLMEPKQVLDPTMLLDVDDYIELIKRKSIRKNSGNLFVCILDDSDEKRKLVSIISECQKMKPFKLNTDIVNNIKRVQVVPSIEQWLRGFYDAEFVVTDSFHACVFSILFKKPFIVYGNTKRGMTRFYSLLKLFDLEERLILSLDDFDKHKFHDIDWDLIEIKLIKEKDNSMSFLREALK